ncbi:hypothetical protein BC937DRAFT_88173 [Endogone sp. FLAS-F59071]|nr:hypothetical protein BC937DRAFT_88173 [Endogone sp. FLAS-F59071]|eukprot:RUS18922.1 hypothetical protein BC937DRAFT_88173 [Endogone sp. FLAS-F59071]
MYMLHIRTMNRLVLLTRSIESSLVMECDATSLLVNSLFRSYPHKKTNNCLNIAISQYNHAVKI